VGGVSPKLFELKWSFLLKCLSEPIKSALLLYSYLFSFVDPSWIGDCPVRSRLYWLIMLLMSTNALSCSSSLLDICSPWNVANACCVPASLAIFCMSFSTYSTWWVRSLLRALEYLNFSLHSRFWTSSSRTWRFNFFSFSFKM